MVRINLLPKEITERRKFDHAIVYVVIVGAVCVAIAVAVWLLLVLQVNGKNDELQTREERAATALRTAEDYRIFEERESVLAERFIVAQLALSGRTDWGRFLNELSLVLPEDTWLTRLSADENDDEQLQLDGGALDSALDIPDVGFKTVAKTLARLAGLDQATDVWLISATRAVSDEDSGNVPYIEFSVTADVLDEQEVLATGGTAAPAPPEETSSQ